MAMRRIGQILVDLGFITDEQLETLLDEQQQRPGKKLGKLAEEQGYITDDQLAQALAEQWGMQVIHLADITIPPQVLSYVTEPMAQLYRIVPVSFRDGTLTIAVCEPATRGLAVRRGGRNGTSAGKAVKLLPYSPRRAL